MLDVWLKDRSATFCYTPVDMLNIDVSLEIVASVEEIVSPARLVDAMDAVRDIREFIVGRPM